MTTPQAQDSQSVQHSSPRWRTTIPIRVLPEQRVALAGSRQTVQQPQLLAKLPQIIGSGRTPAALLDQGLVSGANFLTNVLLARAFGIRDYGVFALVWIAVMFVNSLQYALIVTPMMSVGPKQDEEDRPSYFGAVVVQELAFAFIAGLGSYLAARFSMRFFPEWRIGGLALPVCGVTLAYLLQEFLRRYFFCTQQSKRALITDVVSYLSQVPIIFWLGSRHIATLSNALWIIAATSLTGFLVCIRWFEPITVVWPAFKTVLLRHWRISRWLVPTVFLQWSAGNLFLLLAPVYYGAAGSAALRAANNIVGVAHVWFLGLDNVVPAEAARRFRHAGAGGLMRYLRGVFLLWGGVTLVFGALIAAFPTLWLQIVYGGKYSQDGQVLRLYALLYLILFTLGPIRSGLQAMEYTAPVLWAYPLLIVFAVTFAEPFAHRLGLNGVILGMCCIQLILASFAGGALLLRIRRVRRRSTPDQAMGSERTA
jgi:O-antigen/teichoic acid export membrane protein